MADGLLICLFHCWYRLLDDGCAHVDVHDILCAGVPGTGEVEGVGLSVAAIDGVADGERQAHFRLRYKEEIAAGEGLLVGRDLHAVRGGVHRGLVFVLLVVGGVDEARLVHHPRHVAVQLRGPRRLRQRASVDGGRTNVGRDGQVRHLLRGGQHDEAEIGVLLHRRARQRPLYAVAVGVHRIDIVDGTVARHRDAHRALFAGIRARDGVVALQHHIVELDRADVLNVVRLTASVVPGVSARSRR